MGKTYYVPRSVKGETRLLYIFSVKSFIATVAFGLVGAGIWYVGSLLGLGLVARYYNNSNFWCYRILFCNIKNT